MGISEAKFVSPVVIGGVGGSGTRVIAQIISEMGVDIGRDLNEPNDDLWMNLLFFRPYRICAGQFDTLESIHAGLMLMQRQHEGLALGISAKELRFLCLALIDLWKTDNFGNKRLLWCLRRLRHFLFSRPQSVAPPQYWGWKEPTSHFYIGQVLGYFRNARYIHVVRHGLDMAFSGNVNQVMRFGRLHDVESSSPPDALRFWVAANRAAVRKMKEFDKRCLILRFEDLCLYPEETVKKIADFIGIRLGTPEIERFAGYVKRPGSIGRYRGRSLEGFDKEDLAALADFGYAV